MEFLGDKKKLTVYVYNVQYNKLKQPMFSLPESGTLGFIIIDLLKMMMMLLELFIIESFSFGGCSDPGMNDLGWVTQTCE
jgi:hypothetical protein